MDNLWWFLGIMAVLFTVWFSTGGPERGNTERPFLLPPPPLDTGESYGPIDFVPEGPFVQRRTPAAPSTKREVPPLGKETPMSPARMIDAAQTETPEEEADISLLGGKVSFTFRGRTGARADDPQKENVEVTASRSNPQPINITGWRLKSQVTGKSATIPKGSYLPYAGQVNPEERIFLAPGEKATIATGRSPIGVSFRLNLCTGFFEQFQDFTPFLPRECPYPRSEGLPVRSADAPGGFTDECLDLIERIPRCEVYIKALPLTLSRDPVCQEYISREITYNGCVARHKNDERFYRNEWRIYLKRDVELWKERRETILLLDEDGKLVDSISY